MTVLMYAERNLPSPGKTASTTMKIRSINREARRNDRIRDRLNQWKSIMREKGELFLLSSSELPLARRY